MLTPQFVLNLSAKLVIVLFAGSGGSCTGIEQALGRHVDIAVNHNPDAISCHAKNHPQTEHHREDVRYISPRDLVRARHVGYFHASPDCTHFSQALGGQPRDTEIRSLSWVVVRWGGQVAPDVITLENVEQIRKWGPLIAKRDKATGRVVKMDGTVAEPGEYVPRRLQHLVPDPKRVGKTWERFLQLLRAQGYVIEHRLLCAADFGAPTTRTRLFMIARRDGMPICWPQPTHSRKPTPSLLKWRSAAECIDFSLPTKSIFDRPKPLADATCRRVAHGLKRFVLDNADPFIVPVTHSGSVRVHDIREPLRTITTAQRGEFMVATPTLVPVGHGDRRTGDIRTASLDEPLGTLLAGGGKYALAAATLVQTGYGEREGQAPRSLDLDKPLGTVVAGGAKHALVTAFVEQANGGHNTMPARAATSPLSTITTSGSQQRLVTAHLAHLRGNCDARSLDEPLRTVSAGGMHHGLVEYQLAPEAEADALRCAAFLVRYYGEGGQLGDLNEPMHTITTKARLALVTVWIQGEPWVIVDICLRMLSPRELANATSFPPQYIIDRGHDGRIFSKSKQVAMIGNAVPPLLQRAVTAANYSEHDLRRAA
ncbi:DNA (cytosine-5)-methyltransferase 1 [Variovorax boronicumulans]|uniref:DNA cytosine methyltransferase n=1 Tax=Variovorax boronicumulans TaxID=436515 RepID=UPI00277F2A38|nr:DNA cytosine methyltransferase [Variovorax boronicumulans]MDQ0068995.1 DNA (cytosine-5)-methyltransferase 1 [Variovorax boronicumulans]